MPPRQPPRPAPKQAPKGGGKGAARGGAKSGARGGAKGGAKGGQRRNPPQPRAGGKGGPLGGRGMTPEQQRQQRAMLDQQRRQREARWWAANHVAMNQLHAKQHHSAGGEAIGTVLNGDRRLRWRTSHAVGAITLLILTAFFTSMALGAQSIGIAVLAFLCLAGFIAVVTVEHSARRFPQPVPAPPVIGEHRLEDLIVEDDPPAPKPKPDEQSATLEALEDLFEVPDPSEPDPKPSAPESEPKAPESEAVEVEPTVPHAPPPVESSGPERHVTAPAETAAPRTIVVPVEAPEADTEPGPGQEVVPPPPRQRASPETASVPDDLSELLLSENRMETTDVTDVAATLIVADLKRSVEFYTDALGLTIADRTEEAAVLEAGFGKVLLWERPDAPPGETGVMHLTFEVGDIDAAFAELNEAGVEFLHLPRTALLGQSYQLRAAAFRDPDGHGMAITEHRER